MSPWASTTVCTSASATRERELKNFIVKLSASGKRVKLEVG